MTTPDIAKVAEGLTEAQRAALINARDMMNSHGGYPFFVMEFQPRQAWPEGIAQFLTVTSDRLTPLGLALRNHIGDDR